VEQLFMAKVSPFVRVQSGPASRGLGMAAYECIKCAVVEGKLAPGEFVSQTQIEERYKLSRAAIRGALARLEQEGLVESLPRRGYRIAQFTAQDVEEIFATRGLIEPIATRLAAGRLSPEKVAELNLFNDVTFIPSDLASERHYVESNRRFHMLVAQASQNRRLITFMQQIHDDLMRLSFLTMSFRDDREDWKSAHAKIIDAIAAGNDKAAEEASRSEIAIGREAAMRALLRNPAISSTNLIPSKYGT
jgi:DNA-binding GntR family transcriptional regulator